MPSQATKTQSEVSAANRASAWGGLVGASRWGLLGLGLGVVGYFISPIYRNLTFQFKVYLQISIMSLGGFLEADRRLRNFEDRTRLMRRAATDDKVWRKWEGLVEEERRLEGLRVAREEGREREVGGVVGDRRKKEEEDEKEKEGISGEEKTG